MILALSFMASLSGTSRGQDGTLDQLVQELLQKNPAILAARRAVDAKRAVVLPARTLPDPSITYENMGNLIPPTLQAGDPSSARVLRLAQEIPFPGKLNLQGQIASAEADAEMWRYEEVRREAVSELKMAYYDLFLAQKLTDVVEKSRDLLLQFSEISQARYKVGQAAQQDVLKAQVEVSRLLDRLAVLRQEKETAQVRINTLLYRPPDTPIARLQELQNPKLSRTLDELYQLALAKNPQVQMNRKDIDRGELGVSLAKKSFYPDFEFGFSFYNRSDMPQMYGLMVKATVPLYFWRKQRPELEAATSELIGQRRQYESTLSTLYFRLKDPFLKTTTDANLLELYGGAIIPQATLALESSISSYRVGAVDFLTLVSNQTTVLEYEMKYYEVLADFYKALASLEAITGEVLAE
ncbi:MAG: TolC family protein [Acidobacteriia bacterium]|nr:TolC family protein [Terriglobia bacterium]